MLALSEDGDTYHPRYGCTEYSVEADRVVSTWRPFAGVTVTSTIIPRGEWHVRVHRITTDRTLYAAEGGFALARGKNGEDERIERADCAAAIAPWGVSAVCNLRGYTGGTVVLPEPNTNLMAPRTLLPTLTAKIEPGEHVLVSAVLGTVTGGRALLDDVPAYDEI